MVIDDDNSTCICHQCIGEMFLRNELAQQGNTVSCKFCGETQAGLTLEDLAERIHTAVSDHFDLTSDQPSDGYDYFLDSEGRWERRGDPAKDVIAEIGRLEIEVAEEVTEFLSARYGYRALREEGREDPYGSEAMYETAGPRDEIFHRKWADYCREVQSESRFFSLKAESLLKDIFGDLNTHQTVSGLPVIREIGPGTDTPFVWRARLAEKDDQIIEILKSPARRVSSPPTRKAKGGRMNAWGISVFYGAFDKKTCVAEVRPPVGSKVVVAKFLPLRTLRLLDFDALAEIDDSGSYFDPGYAERRGRASFFDWLVTEISRPVMRDEEEFEHIPTQAMAEYLASRVFPRLDGIIYRSTQVGGRNQNLVLFKHASRVELKDVPPRDRVEVYLHSVWDDEITVFERDEPSTTSPAFFGDDEEFGREVDPALRLEPSKVLVLDITGTDYNYDPINVRRVTIPSSTQGQYPSMTSQQSVDPLLEDLIS